MIKLSHNLCDIFVYNQLCCHIPQEGASMSAKLQLEKKTFPYLTKLVD
jgi:hypothetical protein